jgi:endonuclease/exonuclease/phosphatase family metal-dependent hydrolase
MVTVATFNVKDFFDSPKNAPVLREKARGVAKEIARAEADVVALQEVGSEALVREVMSHVPGGEAYAVLFGGADARGIGNAIVTRLPVLSWEAITTDSLPFPVFREGDAPPFPGRLRLRRPVVRASLAFGGHTVTFFCTHWKSKLPKAKEGPDGKELWWEGGLERAEADLRSLVSRAAEALFVRGLVEARASAGEEVVVLGDLNDTASSVPVRIVRAEGLPHELFPATDAAPAEARTSVLHRGTPEQIDHVLVTAGLRERVREASFFNEALRDHPFSPDAEPTVDSDHAMVVVRFVD